MRAVVLVLLVACYGAPDYAGTMFKCDDQHPCPEGQACIAGVCGGSVGSGFDGVKCGAGGVCTGGQVCCAAVALGPFHCIPANGSCLGGMIGTCDGVEDCAAGQRCCMDGNDNTACGPDTCPNAACTDSSDCPTNKPTCMPIPSVQPWGICV